MKKRAAGKKSNGWMHDNEISVFACLFKIEVIVISTETTQDAYGREKVNVTQPELITTFGDTNENNRMFLYNNGNYHFELLLDVN